MKKVNIKEVEPQFAQKLEVPLKAVLQQLGYSIPESFRLRIALVNAEGRKKRSNAAADTWAPESDRMQCWLEPSKEGLTSRDTESPTVPDTMAASDREHGESSGSSVGSAVLMHPAEVELLKALDRAESTPGWSFVSLKKFRDEILPAENVPSLRTDVERQNVLRSAIEKRFILRKPIPNPKSPQFPVTSIRLNRLMPEVQSILGKPKSDLGFHPIHIKGEPLSATILRERR